LWKLLDHQASIRFSGFAVKVRRSSPWLVLIALSAAGTPALAREGASPTAPDRAELQRDVKETSVKYRKAKADADRLAAEIARIEDRLVGVDEQQADLRSMATKGAVTLYMHDSTSDWADGFGDGGEQVLEAARRARLIGDINKLAAAAVRNLGDSTKQIIEDRKRLREKRQEQEVALAQLDGERQTAVGRFSAFVAAERNEARSRREAEMVQRRAESAQRKAEAAARRAQRTSRSAAANVGADAPMPLGFACPMAGPFKWGDGWGAGRGHKGTDMLAPRGSEQVAVVSGTFETKFWGGGGLTLFLLGDDGHTYTYMHLMRVVGEQGRHVQQGEVIALTGASGNASAYHLHFEFHPNGEGAVDPRAMLVKACPPMPRDH
jgi:murein DD-endopeptidase MepM/ murein hydrolase activator NlpD